MALHHPPFLFIVKAHENYISIDFLALKKFGKPTSNKTEEGEKVTNGIPFSLKPKQIPIVDAFLKAADEVGGGIGSNLWLWKNCNWSLSCI